MNCTIAGDNGAGIAVVAVHGQVGPVAEGLAVIQGLLPSGLQLGGDLAFRLGLRAV